MMNYDCEISSFCKTCAQQTEYCVVYMLLGTVFRISLLFTQFQTEEKNEEKNRNEKSEYTECAQMSLLCVRLLSVCVCASDSSEI